MNWVDLPPNPVNKDDSFVYLQRCCGAQFDGAASRDTTVDKQEHAKLAVVTIILSRK